MKYAKKKQRSSLAGILLTIILMLSAFIGGTWFGAEVLSADRNPTPEAVPGPSEIQETEAQEIVGETEAPEATEAVQPEETAPAEQAPAVSGKNTVYELNDTDVVVPTPYCNLYYPAQFEEFLRISHEFSNELYAVHFNANFGEGSTSNLFSVYFAKDDGKQPDGIIVGGLPDENGDIMLVIVVTNSGVPRAEWSQDTANLVYAMQENISYCMEKISGLDNLVLDQ